MLCLRFGTSSRQACGNVMQASRVVVVDDHPIVQAGYEKLFGTCEDKELIACFHRGEEISAAYAQLKPDLVILELLLPGISGIETTKRLLRRDAEAKVLIHTPVVDVVYICQAMQSGARGYLSKHAPLSQLLKAIEQISTGGIFLEPELAQQVAYLRTTVPENPFNSLTPREFEVAMLLTNGESLETISTRLSLSYKTVANHSASIRAKLGTRNLADLVKLAMRHGLLQAQ